MAQLSQGQDKPEKHIQKGNTVKLRDLTSEEEQFHRFIIGQDHAVKEFAKLLVKIRSGLRFASLGPMDVKFLAGPSGVGKTEMVYVLASILLETMGDIGSNEAKNEANKKVLKLNGAEYQLEHEVAKLLGAPPGYIGHQTSNDTTSIVLSPAVINQYKLKYKNLQDEEREMVIILIDEAEKAHPTLHKIFLSAMEKGQMRLGNNTEVDFSNAVIFFTSNVGTAEAEKAQKRTIGLVKPSSAKTSDKIIREAFRKTFPPEFRGRIKDLIIFEGLSKEMAENIARLKLRNAESGLLKSGLNIRLQITDAALNQIIRIGIGHSEGARFLEKLIEKEVWDPLAVFSSPSELHGNIVSIERSGSNGLVLLKTKMDARVLLQKWHQESISFFLNHGLVELAKDLEGNLVLTDSLIREIQKNVDKGFFNGFIMPSHSLQIEQGARTFQAMVNEPSQALKKVEQYVKWKDGGFQQNFESCLNMTGPTRPAGNYLVLYRHFMDAETVGAGVPNLTEKFNKNGWQSFSVVEYLIAQRIEAEKRENHIFDQWAIGKQETGSGWLLNYNMEGKFVYTDWSPLLKTIRILLVPNNNFSNVGAHPIIVIPIEIIKATAGK